MTTFRNRLISPVWRGISPLAFVFGALMIAGLFLQLAQGWASPFGDVLWLLGSVAVAVIGLTAGPALSPQPSLLLRISLILLGLYTAGLMAYWIAFDSGRLAALGWEFLIPVIVLAATVVMVSIGEKRTTNTRL
jgi:hypothetical protein